MPITNFPNGVSSFGIPVFGSGPIITTGNIFFVSSVSGSNSNIGTDPSKPFATIDYAIGKCTANNGDHIIAMPGHIETLNAAGDVTFDVAGVTCIGIGSGAARPQFLFNTASTVDINFDAASIVLDNFLMLGGRDAIVAPLDVNAADCTFRNIEWRDASGQQALRAFVIDANANRTRILNFRYNGDTAAGAAEAIQIQGADNVVIDGFFCDGDFSVGCINIATTACTDLEVRNCIARNRNSVDIFLVDTITGSTGMIGPNIYFRCADNAANITEALTGATFVYFPDIYIVNNAGEQAMLTNITASTDA